MNKFIIVQGSKEQQVQHSLVWALGKQHVFSQDPHWHFSCACKLCAYFDTQKSAAQVQKFMAELMTPSNSQPGLQNILRWLTSPKNKSIGARLLIRINETCFFNQGEPVSIFMNEEDTSVHQIKKNITSTTIQKLFNDNRRKYREGLGGVDCREAVLLEFREQPSQLISESEFIGLLAKRKSDPFWSTLLRMSNFTSTESYLSQRYYFYYHQSSEQRQLLGRARQLIESQVWYSKQSDPDFISQKSQLQFVHSLSHEDKVKYSTYKIVEFARKAYSVDIARGMFDWYIQSNNEVVLLNATGLQFTQMPKFDWHRQTYENRMADYLNTTFRAKERHKRATGINYHKAGLLAQRMNKDFDDIRFKLGLQHKEEDNSFLEAGDIAYTILHPGAHSTLSEMLKSGLSTNLILGKTPIGRKQRHCKLSEVIHKLTVPVNKKIKRMQIDPPSMRMQSMKTPNSTTSKRRSMVSTSLTKYRSRHLRQRKFTAFSSQFVRQSKQY